MNDIGIASTALQLINEEEKLNIDPSTGEVIETLPIFDAYRVDYYGKLLNELALREADYAEKEEIYKKRKKSAQNSIEWLQGRLQESMRINEQREVMGVEYRFISYTSGKKVSITDENQIPEEFFLQKITTSPNRELLKKILTEGHDIPGVTLEDIRIFKSGVK